ncbi:MAG: hypothetical protein NVSMB6_24380 [Burkholderiaceae bacterium]
MLSSSDDLPMAAGRRQCNPDEALEIAMDYLEGTGQAFPYSETQRKVADAILAAWRSQVSHKKKLANHGIVAVEKKSEMKPLKLYSFYPRAS